MANTDVSQRLAKLSRKERALLFERLQGKKTVSERIGRRPASADPPPLSFAQQRLWFLDRLAPGDVAYNLPNPLEILGPLDAAALERALHAVTQRHESLRTTIGTPEGTGEPVQVIAADPTLVLPLVDLSALRLPESPPAAELRRLVREDAGRPFHLGRGPLLRVTLLRLAAERHVLLLTQHHIISDGWSISILVRETVAFYRALLEGLPHPDLPELPIQYGDFAVWQRGLLSGAPLEALVGHFRAELAGAPLTLDLPTDRPRPPYQTSSGGTAKAGLDVATSQDLRALSLASGATPFIALLSAFSAFLGRYSGQDDVLVGTPIANRQRTEIEGLIGFFANTLVLRGRLAGDPTFRELVERTRKGALGGYSHQDLPFEKLVEELKPERDTSRSPLFQVMFLLQNLPQGDLAVAELEIRGMPVGMEAAKFDLTLGYFEGYDELFGTLSYNTDLFDAATARRMVDHFRNLTAAAVAAPDRRLSELPLLSPAEVAECLAEAGQSAAPAAAAPLLHERVLAQAACTPDAPALEFAGPAGDVEVSYGELARQVETLARQLVALGVRRDIAVGLAVERSPELVIGLLAIHAAGGVYLPLDPSYPEERLAFMLADAGAALVLSDRPWTGALPPGVRARTLADLAHGEQARGPLPNPWPDDIAYVIYTSGSTGRPKGVMVPHRGLANLTAQGVAFGTGPGSRVLQFSSPCFDVSLLDVLVALAYGGTLVLAPRTAILPGRELAELLAARRITHALLPPSALAVLPRLPLPALTDLGVTGEHCPSLLAAAWGVGRRVWNVYGPTEATVHVTLGDVADGHVVLGEVLGGIEVHLLDRGGSPVPRGVVGEIFLGGLGLARGYLDRPELTAERFLPHPLAARPGERLYRTGDLGRRLPSGALEYLGRADRQVKVRGFRIEPEEIEAVLAEHPAVAEAAVVPKVDAAGSSFLAAFVVLSRECELDDLRRFLGEKLPPYMVPGPFTRLEALPRSPAGKLDRRGLESAARLAGQEERSAVPPRTELERALANLWAELLGSGPVGIEDNFFDLGGHSLLLPQVQRAIQERAGVEVPLLALFEYTTVRSLAAYLEGGPKEAPSAPAVEPRDRAAQMRDARDLQRRRLQGGRGAGSEGG